MQLSVALETALSVALSAALSVALYMALQKMLRNAHKNDHRIEGVSVLKCYLKAKHNSLCAMLFVHKFTFSVLHLTIDTKLHDDIQNFLLPNNERRKCRENGLACCVPGDSHLVLHEVVGLRLVAQTVLVAFLPVGVANRSYLRRRGVVLEGRRPRPRRRPLRRLVGRAEQVAETETGCRN